MDTVDQLLVLADAQHGLVTRRQARSVGMDRRAVRRLGTTHHWEDVTDEVVRRRGSATTDAQRLLAGVLDAGEGAALSVFSAGSWWGLGGCRRFPAQVTRTSTSRRTSEIAEIRTVRCLPDRWVTRLDGIPIVRPELLALQLFAECSEGRGERLVESLWAMGLISGASLARFLDELGRSGRNGTAALRRYLEPRGVQYVPAASGLEARTAQILASVGIELRRQVDSGADGWTGRVDFRHATFPFVLEVQSERFHSALADRRADAARLEQLRHDGFVVVEVTDVQVWTDPQAVVDSVRDGLRRAAAGRPLVSFRD